MRKSLRYLVTGAFLLSVAFFSGAMQTWMPEVPGTEGVGASGEGIDFGSVPVGQTQTAQYTFKVLETSETAAAVTIYDPCPPFGFSGLAARSMTLQPGESITFGVTFTPPQAQSYTCSFVIRAAGGYPVQETETVVNLSGQGAATGESPSETPGTTVPEFPFQLPSIPSAPPAIVEGISGMTDSSGEFEVSPTPGTSVAGKLSECSGPTLGGREFRLSPSGEGYEILMPGYAPAEAQPVARISFFGLESVDLGNICLDPVIEEVSEPPLGPEIVESDECPCCFITIEARMCCNPKGEYVETNTVYETQDVIIRVAYCEPAEALGDVDLTTLPLTSTGGRLINPGLLPPPSIGSAEPSQIGVTSITLNGKVLFEGDGELEKTIHSGWLMPGTYTVRVTMGRINGKECFCEKTFEVLACPDIDAELTQTITPEGGCAPVTVTYDLSLPEGSGDICEVTYKDNTDPVGTWERMHSLSFTVAYEAIDECIARLVKPEATFLTNDCCRYSVPGEPFTVNPPFLMSEDCICIRLVPKQDRTIDTRLVFQRQLLSSGELACILCDDYKVTIDWGDGTTSDERDIADTPWAGESTITHQYERNPESVEQRPFFTINVEINDECGSLSKTLTTRCPFPSDLIPESNLDRFLELSGTVSEYQEVAGLVHELSDIFGSLGKTQGGTIVCSVLLSVQIKGLDMEGYTGFDSLRFFEGSAGGIFEHLYVGQETGARPWRFYESPGGSAKLVYVPGESPYFELVVLQGGCDDCPVLPIYRTVSSLTDTQVAQQRAEDARESLGSTTGGQESTLPAEITIYALLEIGLCCRPDMCEE